MPEKSQGGSSRQGLAKASRVQAMPRGPRGLTPQLGLGKAIRFFREKAKMTQKGLAEKSGVSASWIAKIEDGQVDPTWATIERIAKGLSVSMESLAEAAERFEETKKPHLSY